MSNPLSDMEKPDVIFCIGTNMTECHPVAATRLKKALARGAKMIVADPRRIRLAEMADLYLPIRVGSDTALLLAMAHVIAREGLVDEDFIEPRARRARLISRTRQGVHAGVGGEITGVPAADIEQAAILYAQAERGAIYYTLGITEHICGVDNVQSLCNLALMTGNIGREGTGINPMRGQNNIQGAGDCGALPNNYPRVPAGRPIRPTRPSSKPPMGARSISRRASPRSRALARAASRSTPCSSTARTPSSPIRTASTASTRSRSLDHLVVIDIFLTETAELADVVLPATGWGETDGIFTNTERRVQRLRRRSSRPARPSPTGGSSARSPSALASPASSTKRPTRSSTNSVRSRRSTPVSTGIWRQPADTSGRCRTKDIRARRACTKRSSPTGADLFADRVSGSGRDHRRRVPGLADDRPSSASYHTRTQTGRSTGIDYLLPEELLEVHPDDVADGATGRGMARMTSRRGAVTIKVEATTRSPRGTVFCSFSFDDVPVNILTGAGYDPVTHTAELKVCPVRVEPVG